MQDVLAVESTTGIMLSAWEKAGIMGVFIVMFVFSITLMGWLVVSGNKRYERTIMLTDQLTSMGDDIGRLSKREVEMKLMAQTLTDMRDDFKEAMKRQSDSTEIMHKRIDDELRMNAQRRVSKDRD